MKVKMIASWGNSGGGKSTTALALATCLAGKSKNAVIISSDAKAPALPIFLPTSNDIEINGSIGQILSSSDMAYSDLKGKIHLHPKSSRIGFAGFVSGENPLTYRAFERDNLISFIEILHNSPFEYIIFDCESNPIYDSLTLLALETADIILRVTTPDVRGFEFAKSQLAWLRHSDRFNTDCHIKIASSVRRTTPIDAVSATFGGFDYILPMSDEVYDKFCGGELLNGFHDFSGIAYEKEIERLTERVIQNG